MSKYIGALDQGTTSTRFILFSTEGRSVATAKREHEQIKTHIDWLEHDPNEILRDVEACIDECVERAQVSPDDILAVGITNQRETTVVWDKQTGNPLCNAIVWSDNRTHKTCADVRRKISDERVRELTGLKISPYFSGIKLRWMMDNEPGLREKIQNGQALFGTIDTWLVWCLTGEYKTDVTNAGRTMMMNLRTLGWEDEILNVLEVPRSSLPTICSSAELFGVIKEGTTRLEGKPICGILGDQQSALVGQACFQDGEGKNTYGTGSFFILNTGTTPHDSRNLLTTPAYKFGAECCYALEGSVESAGRVVDWMVNELGLIKSVSEIEGLANMASKESKVFFVPAFNGLYAPFWEDDARATIIGMTLATKKEDICKAALQSIALRVCDVLEEAKKDMGHSVQELRVDGGASVNNLLLKMQADLARVPVVRPKEVETTALGAAFAAGYTVGQNGDNDVGVFSSLDKFKLSWQQDRRFEPTMPEDDRDKILSRWKNAVDRSRHWM